LKDSDYSLVSNENLSQKLSSSSWGSGPGNLRTDKNNNFFYRISFKNQIFFIDIRFL